MKQYYKPVFRIAGSVLNPGQKISCTTTDEDLELIASILGVDVSALGGEDAFAPSENCAKPVALDIYCKFTSVANGLEAIFQS